MVIAVSSGGDVIGRDRRGEYFFGQYRPAPADPLGAIGILEVPTSAVLIDLERVGYTVVRYAGPVQTFAHHPDRGLLRWIGEPPRIGNAGVGVVPRLDLDRCDPSRPHEKLRDWSPIG